MNSENPQYDARQFDAPDPDAQYEGGHDVGPAPQGDAPHPDETSGPPYRAIAMVLLSAVVVAIGIGLVQLFGGDDDEAATAEEGTSQVEQQDRTGQAADGQGGEGQAAQGQVGPDGQPLPPAADGQDPAAPGAPGPDAGQPVAEPGEQGQAPADSAPAVSTVPVVIYNNSTVTGLAGRTGDQLRASGFAVGDVANMPSNRGVVPESTAFYGAGPGEQEAAQAIGAQLGIAVQPRPADMVDEGPGVIVIVTQDLDR